MSVSLPLQDIQVVDFGHCIAGPAVGMMLADLGATVIKVLKPRDKDPDYNAIVNRNKLLVCLDLKTEQGLEQARTLISKADIIIENFRPGVMKKLGLDFSQLVEENRRLIAISLPGFASNDKVMSRRKATEAIIQAHSGVFSEMGPNRTLMGIEPSYSTLPLSSIYGATIATSAALFCLQDRESSGSGDYIEVPLCSALTECLLSFNAIKIHEKPERYKDLREIEIEKRKKEGLLFDLHYNELFSYQYMDPFYRPYQCKDGRPYYLVSIAHSCHADRALNVLGVYQKVKHKIMNQGNSLIENTFLPKNQWGRQISFNTYPVSYECSRLINVELEKVFKTKRAFEWESILSSAGAIGGAFRTLHEWMYSSHAINSRLFELTHDYKIGDVFQPAVVAWSGAYANKIVYRSRRKVTFKQALSKFKTNQSYKIPYQNAIKKGWLDGIKILDLSNVIAGPHSACVLARYGAEVIKIDSAIPTFGPSYILYSLNTGQGKKSALIDIKTQEGYQILYDLIKKVDIVICNATDKQLSKLKLTHAEIKKINPKVILSQLDLYGSLSKGEMSNYIGYDDIAQAVTGIMTRFGEGLDSPEEHAHLGTIDVMCGFASTIAVATSLYVKKKRKKIISSKTSLSACAGLLQIPFIINSMHKEPEITKRNSIGRNVYSRFYQCANKKWIFIDSDSNELELALKNIKNILITPSNQLNQSILETIFKDHPSEFWVEKLSELNVAIAQVNHMNEIVINNLSESEDRDENKKSYAFTRFRHHPCGYMVDMVEPHAVRTKYADIYRLKPTEKYGTSTLSILRKLQYSNNQIQDLISKKIISEYWSEQYLPN